MVLDDTERNAGFQMYPRAPVVPSKVGLGGFRGSKYLLRMYDWSPNGVYTERPSFGLSQRLSAFSTEDVPALERRFNI